MHLIWCPWYLMMCKTISQISIGIIHWHQSSKIMRFDQNDFLIKLLNLLNSKMHLHAYCLKGKSNCQIQFAVSVFRCRSMESNWTISQLKTDICFVHFLHRLILCIRKRVLAFIPLYKTSIPFKCVKMAFLVFTLL